METQAIEQRTIFSFDHGEITRYETNVPCGDLRFDFHRPMVTMMLSGEKNIAWGADALSFKPNTVFIPPNKEKMTVDIFNASAKTPTKCIVLDLDDAFVSNLYNEVIERWNPEWVNMQVTPSIFNKSYNTKELLICDIYHSLYNALMHGKTDSGSFSFLLDLKLKELVFSLLKERAQRIAIQKDVVDDSSPISEVINYINQHFMNQISVQNLSKMACMSNAIFFKKFKDLLGCTPVMYVINKRIAHSKTLLTSTVQPIGEIVYNSGFQSFEYFCRKFKALEGMTPAEFRKNYSLFS